MKTKFFLCALAFALTAPSAFAEFADTHGDRSKEAVDFLEQSGVVQGYGDGTFRPLQNITRTEFLKIVLEANDNYKSDCSDPKITFPDVSSDDWFAPYVCYAVNNGIANGYPDGTFKPHSVINFAEASKIISNIFALGGTEGAGEQWYLNFKEALKKERVIPDTVESDSALLTRGDMSEIVWGIQTGFEVENKNLGDLPTANSCEELGIQLEKYNKRANYGFYPGGPTLMRDLALPEAAPTAPPMEGDSTNESKAADGAAADYSTTNLQELGVDEADIIKNDGSHIFVIKDNHIVIVKAYPPTDMQQTASITFEDSGFQPLEMYLDGDRLTVIGYAYQAYGAQPQGSEKVASASAMIMPPYYGGGELLKIIVFNVADRSDPKIVRTVSMESSYVDSRKIGDTVYLVANKYTYYYGGPTPLTEDTLPKFSDSANSAEKIIAPCGDIRYFPNFQDPNYLIVSAINTRDASKKVNRQVFLGTSQEVYASTKSLYVVRPTYEEVYNKYGDNESWSYGEFAEIFKFALDGDNVEYKAKGQTEGRVLNQFAMSEYNDYFRIATQKGWAWDSNTPAESGITIFDRDMKETGSVGGIGKGEDMKSARFVGKVGYLVTFKTVDPLFVIDLTPTAPKVKGELKIPGWSDYLHPYDETHLIGFGKEVDESIDADLVHSDNAVYYTAVLGMKLSIFDVSDLANPKEIHKEVIGYRGTQSEVLYNHKALLFDKAKGILAFPITVTANKNGLKGLDAEVETVFSGAYVYDISLDKGFTLRGKTSNFEAKDYAGSGEWFSGDYNKAVQRIIYIGNNFYSVAQGVVKALAWNDISEVNSVWLDQ